MLTEQNTQLAIKKLRALHMLTDVYEATALVHRKNPSPENTLKLRTLGNTLNERRTDFRYHVACYCEFHWYWRQICNLLVRPCEVYSYEWRQNDDLVYGEDLYYDVDSDDNINTDDHPTDNEYPPEIFIDEVQKAVRAFQRRAHAK